MKQVCSTIVITVGLACGPLLGQERSVAGDWNLEMSWREGGTSTGTCTLQQQDQAVTGTCGSAEDRFPVRGELQGNRLSLHVDVAQTGMDFSGELNQSQNAIRGECVIPGVNTGMFTLTKVR